MPNTNRTLSILSAVLSVSGFVLLAWTLLDPLGGPWWRFGVSSALGFLGFLSGFLDRRTGVNRANSIGFYTGVVVVLCWVVLVPFGTIALYSGSQPS